MVIKRYKAEKQLALQVFNAIKYNDFLLRRSIDDWMIG
jgi:hypothetical protein